MSILEHALQLWRRGFNVMPLLPSSKEPAGKWKEYQSRRVAEKEIRDWWGNDRRFGVAIITGAISQVIVVDADIKRGGLETIQAYPVPRTLTAVTPSGGRHYYFKYPGIHVRNRVDLLPGVDVRGDGGYVVAPPTVLPQGTYRWEDPDAPVADAPEWLLELFTKETENNDLDDGWYAELLKGVPVGERDNAAIRLVGRWVRRGLSDEEITALLLVWNRKNRPPMGEHPGDPDVMQWVKEKITSARRMEEERKRTKPLAEELIERLRSAENHRDRMRLVQELAQVLDGAEPLEREYYVEQARKASGLGKTALSKMLQQAAAPKGPEPVPLEEPRRTYVAVSQDFYKGTFYYGMWLPTNPRACTPEEYVFKLVTSERTLLDPPKGLPLPSDYARWSVDKVTPYNVFEWLRGERELNARELLDELADVFAEFMWYPHLSTPLILALWVMGTYVYMCFDSASYLAFVGTRRTGKSRTLTLLERLCYNALYTMDISTAALARSIGMGQCTALVDEAEFTSSPIVAQGGVDERLSILLSSYQRGKLRIRSEGDTHTPRGYDPYSPKAFATMNRLPDALADRAIPVKVGRVPPGGKNVGDLVLFEQGARFQLLRNKLHFFGLTYASRLVQRAREVLSLLREHGIMDRERDIWLVLACIALEIGGKDLLERVVEYARACIQEKRGQEQSSYTIAVIWACLQLLGAAEEDRDEDTKPVRVEPQGEWYLRKTLRKIVAEYMGLDVQQVSAERIGRELVSTGIIENTSEYRRQLWDKKYRGERAYLLCKDRVMDAAVRYEVDEVAQLFGGAKT